MIKQLKVMPDTVEVLTVWKGTDIPCLMRTTDYSLFGFIEDYNRDINPNGLKKLEKSMNTHDFSIDIPIVVNEYCKIKLGQHRGEVAKRRNAPIYFIVGQEVGIDDLPLEGNNSTKWSIKDYIKYHSNNSRHYKELRQFKLDRDLTYQTLLLLFSPINNKYSLTPEQEISILRQRTTGSAGHDALGSHFYDQIKNGKFEITKDMKMMAIESYAIYKNVIALCPESIRVRLFNSFKFCRAVIRIITNVNIDIDVLYRKLETYSDKIKIHGDHVAYVDMLAEIYNTNKPSKKKLIFKY